MNTHYTTSTLSGFQHILSLFSLLPRPPPLPLPPHLALHTKLFPTILRHEFIPMTMETTYQIVLVSLMYFSFSNLPIRRLDRQEKPFLTGPALHVWRTFGSEGEENFWRNVPFRGAVWESWFQSHRESFNYSPLNAFRLFLGGFAYVLHKWFMWNEAQSRMDTCKYERGRACVAPAPFNF